MSDVGDTNLTSSVILSPTRRVNRKDPLISERADVGRLLHNGADGIRGKGQAAISTA